MSAPLTSSIQSDSGLVRWSTGELFDGYLMVGLASPVGLEDTTILYYGSITKQQLPVWCRIPIVSGVIDTVSRVYQNSTIDPPASKYAIYWTDRAFNVLQAPEDLVTIATDPYIITVPTLDAPAVPTQIPLLQQSDTSGGSSILTNFVNGELLVRGQQGQTDPLQEWQLRDGTVQASLGVDGVLKAKGYQSAFLYTTVNVTLTVANSVVLVDTSLGNVAITLPPATDGTAGRTYTIKYFGGSSANTCHILRSASDNIDGFTTYNLPNFRDAITVVCAGSGVWSIIGHHYGKLDIPV